MSGADRAGRTRRAGGTSLRYRRRRRTWPAVLIGVLVLALAGTAGWLVGFSSVLATERVEVHGAEVISKSDVLDTAEVVTGLPLARQDIDAIAGRVAALTPVEEVEVTRQYPSTVMIMITERTPVLGVDDGDKFLLLDRFGVPYRRVAKLPKSVLPAELNAGNTALAVQLGQVTLALPDELRKKVKQVSATSESTIELRLDDGDRVIWGTSDDSALKATVLQHLLNQKQKAKTYNVSAPHHPALN